jgi:hypothetical protein
LRRTSTLAISKSGERLSVILLCLCRGAPSAANADGLYHLPVLRDSVILILRLRQEGVAGHEYARRRIGASNTRANSGNGALPTRELEQGENNETKSRHASEA